MTISAMMMTMATVANNNRAKVIVYCEIYRSEYDCLPPVQLRAQNLKQVQP